MRIAATLLLAGFVPAAMANVPPPEVNASAWLLADLSSGQVLGARDADRRIEPASLTKLMTAYLAFAALREGRLMLDRRVTVPAHVVKVPGSRMFIEPGKPVTGDELIRGLVVQSGNDASIALAAALDGSEQAFVQRMNREAARLGMKATRYANATGLPDPAHYSTAADLHRLAAALIRDFPERYAAYYAQKEFRYNGIKQWNRNRLLWLDASVDGVKTGHTETAGYCLIASALRGERRLLAVLLGARSENARARQSLELLNWGYQAFDTVKLYERGETVKLIEVWKGARGQLRAGVRGALVVTLPKGAAQRLEAALVSQPPLLAPVAEGERVGLLRLTLDGKPYGEHPVVALETVAVAGFFGRSWDTLRLWMR